MSGLPWESRSFRRHRRHVHTNVQRVVSAAVDDAANGADVAVIAAPCEEDVPFSGDAIVGGIHLHPFMARGIDGQPCVGGVGVAHRKNLPQHELH